MRGKKAAVELSMNFLVVIIISIIIFGFGIYFISRLSSQADDLTKLTEKQIDDHIESVLCDSSARVCIGTERKTIQKAKFAVFGIKILNIDNSQSFTFEVTESNPIGFKKDNTPITGDSLIVNPTSRIVYVERNEEKKVGVGVQVPASAQSGTYILNVEIKSQDGNLYVPVQKLYVEVP